METSFKLTSGVNVLTLEANGKTVAEIREQMTPILGIDPEAVARINGVEVPADTVVLAGVELEFVKVSGKAGA